MTIAIAVRRLTRMRVVMGESVEARHGASLLLLYNKNLPISSHCGRYFRVHLLNEFTITQKMRGVTPCWKNPLTGVGLFR